MATRVACNREVPVNTMRELQQIAGLAQQGRLDEAARLVEGAIARNPEDPAFLALGGAIEFHRGAHQRAVSYLKKAQVFRPQDPVIRANLVEALLQMGDLHGAHALCDRESALGDPSLRLARLGAYLAQEVGEFATAVELYRHVTSKVPADWASWNNLGNALTDMGKPGEAVAALEQAVRVAPDAPPIRINLGETLLLVGRVEEAVDVLSRASTDFPEDPHPLLALFRHYLESGEEDRAFAVLQEASRRAPDRADIQTDFGHVAGQRNEFARAEEALERALAVSPGFTPAFVGLAAVLERVNREGELEGLRERASREGAEERVLAFIDALRLKRADRFEDALARLDDAGDVMIASRKWQLRGELLDRLGREDEAFAAFAAMNEAWQQDGADPRARAAAYRQKGEDALALLSPDWLASWSPSPPPAERSPIFVVGFPRSGTTLLDTMLMAVPQVRVLEEEPFIEEIERELGGVAALPSLSQDEILAARARYFERAAALVGTDSETVIVDKHPMHLGKVPVIRRIFPDAQFILALRHPCDVLLSCFITNFRLNAAMANFVDLNDAAALYDLSFRHWTRARDVFDLEVAEVAYEDLIASPEQALRPVFDRLGLSWPEGELDHRKAARARGVVRTASYAQVTSPLYRHAVGRWHRYADHLAPILPMLAPWIEKFGYA